ncbi:sensor histidine kinase [Actinomadura verrucosospora]|uniref:histidine kinase n=1 Tax=Actinomadura verrucosospora TaxID=46165 RepID=A0A7D3VSZ4_ACTVE|nr:nitrate- and nitrite sensing domain-containing protein [Actinomadura verrucosospora]QKG21853.1 sensor-like histidine kinase [Actinomadura verrucosospora]
MRSIRFKVVLMVTVSVVSLGVLWAFAASIALGQGLNLRHVETVQDHFGYPSGALGSALQNERRLSMVYLGSRSDGDRAAMESGRLVTDRQAELFRRLVRDPGARGAAPAQARRLADRIGGELAALGTGRRAIDAGATSRSKAFTDYTGLLADVGSLQGSLATLDNSEVAKDARNEASLSRARETLAEEDAVLAGALAAGRMTPAEHAQFVKLVGTQRALYGFASSELRLPDQGYYQRVTGMPEYARLRAMEDRFVASRALVRPSSGAGTLWKTTADSNLTRLRGLELSVAAGAEKRAKPISDGIITRVVLAGALGLLAVVASLVIAVWVARSVIRELARLRREAIDLADVRLPGVIRRLRRGEDVDVAAEAPPLAFGTREIDQVGEAFNAARRTAIQGAVEEATLRRNVSDVFVNLARRSQTLLHRQLKLLDSMERRIEVPDDLEDLFRVDHLATRMRRHAEGLIILSGQAPGRGWRSPVAIVDVARAAASEVEDYTRVNVAPMTRAAIVGPAVADVIHLLAELIENATAFSPPHTTVQVHGQAVSHGFTLEVEDRGLSMDEPSLAAANERLASGGEFDLSDASQLGLFVVGRLARRHGVKVTLRTSPYGGMTAIVLLPEELVVRAGATGDADAAEAPPALTTRRAEDALVPVGAVAGGHRADGPAEREEGGAVLRLPSGRHAAPRPEPAEPEPAPGTGRGPALGDPLARPPQPGAPLGPLAGDPFGDDPLGAGPPTGPIGVPAPAASDGPATGPIGWGPDDASGEADGTPGADGPSETTGPRTVFAEPMQGPPPEQRSSPSAWGDPPARREERPAAQRTPRSPREVRRRPPGASRADRPALPKRVRQENMAAQLRAEPAAPPAAEPAPRAGRTPEELRSMMSSIQQGTRRGRAESLDTEDS